MRLCAELADLAMGLARDAAARAHAELTEPVPPQAAAPPAESPPESPIKPAPAAAPSTAPRGKHPSATAIFTRLATLVRHFIVLEARLAAGVADLPPPALPKLSPEARRAALHDALRNIAEHSPEREALLRETENRLDAELTADPDQTLSLPEIFARICDDLAFEIDLSHVPDSILGVAP